MAGATMNSIAKVAKYVKKNPETGPTGTLLALAVALEGGAVFSFNNLYELDNEEFNLAMGMIDDWRLQRYFSSKLRLLDYAEINEAAAKS